VQTLLGRAHGQELPAARATFATQVEHPVRAFDDESSDTLPGIAGVAIEDWVTRSGSKGMRPEP
jgi:hypothetical protein